MTELEIDFDIELLKKVQSMFKSVLLSCEIESRKGSKITSTNSLTANTLVRYRDFVRRSQAPKSDTLTEIDFTVSANSIGHLGGSNLRRHRKNTATKKLFGVCFLLNMFHA